MTIVTRRWLTLIDTPPAAGVGVALAELATQPACRIVVQFAVVTAAMLAPLPAPTPVWIDITGRVIDVLIRQGDATRESRWPAGQCTINCERFDDLLVHDPFSDSVHPNVRAGVGSLIRVGIIDLVASVDGAAVPAGARWDGLFVGQVESMTEVDVGGDGRWWTISALDACYRMSHPTGIFWNGTPGAEATIHSILGTGFEDLPYTSDVRIAATLLQPYTTVGANNGLDVLHRIADTCNARMYHAGSGALTVHTVSTAGDYPPRWSVIDDPGAMPGAGIPAVPAPAYAIKPTRIVMAQSADRIAVEIAAAAPPMTTGEEYVEDTGLDFRKFGSRVDTPDWPRLDLLSVDIASFGTTVTPAIAARWAEPSRVDTITFDTQPATVRTDGAADLAALDARLTPLTQYCAFLARHGVDTRYTFERRGRGPVAFYSVDFEVHQVEHYLERTNNLFRWRSVHGGKAMYI